MNVSCVKSAPCDIKKKLFTLKPVQKNGLILQIHHTTSQYSVCKKRNIPHRIRFIFTSFDKTGKIIASADIEGNVFIIDFQQLKYWLLPKFDSCSALKFSSLNSKELIIGTNDGKLLILNIHTGCITAIWEEHKHPVRDISFAEEICLTASSQDAIIFSLKTFKKLHALTLKNTTSLKHVTFTPISCNILACFNDYFINVWDSKTFSSIKQILPTTWKKQTIKCLAFTRNGQVMVLAGTSPILIVFSLDSWTITNMISLPVDISSIRLLDFVPQANDGGFNKILAVLSSDGILYFYDMANNAILNQIQHESEITLFEVAQNGQTLVCVLHSGEVNVYKTSHLIGKKEVVQDKKEVKMQQKLKLHLPPLKHVSDVLDIEKLQKILIEFGEYPENYRNIIWTKILNLPNNRECYASFINRGDNNYFTNLELEYPLMNKSALKNLKKLLNNLSNWCAFFGQVNFLPLFVFPFLKIFENDPIASFEALCTIIINWCQHWFEYSPYPPINILAMVENLLLLHDEPLLSHFTKCNVTSHLYAWTLLEVAFSEVLTIKEWCILWDHLLTNEPSLILMAVIAYNIINRSTLLSLNHLTEFESFFHSQNLLNFKRFIAKMYYLNKNTNEDIHPRQYLNFFTALSKREYPVFLDYPRLAQNCTTDSKENTSNSELTMLKGKAEEQRNIQLEKLNKIKILEEERKRLQKLEDLYRDKIIEETERINLRRQAADLYKESEPPCEPCNSSSTNIDEENLPKRQDELNAILMQMTNPKSLGKEDCMNIDKKINENVCQLLEQKIKLQEIMNKKSSKNPKKVLHGVQKEQEILRKEHVELQKDIKKIIKKLNKPGERKPIKGGNSKFTNLEESTKDLENQVHALLNKWAQHKVKETECRSTDTSSKLKPCIKKRAKVWKS